MAARDAELSMRLLSSDAADAADAAGGKDAEGEAAAAAIAWPSPAATALPDGGRGGGGGQVGGGGGGGGVQVGGRWRGRDVTAEQVAAVWDARAQGGGGWADAGAEGHFRARHRGLPGLDLFRNLRRGYLRNAGEPVRDMVYSRTLSALVMFALLATAAFLTVASDVLVMPTSVVRGEGEALQRVVIPCAVPRVGVDRSGSSLESSLSELVLASTSGFVMEHWPDLVRARQGAQPSPALDAAVWETLTETTLLMVGATEAWLSDQVNAVGDIFNTSYSLRSTGGVGLGSNCDRQWRQLEVNGRFDPPLLGRVLDSQGHGLDGLWLDLAMHKVLPGSPDPGTIGWINRGVPGAFDKLNGTASLGPVVKYAQ